jgi:hypothetical protein
MVYLPADVDISDGLEINTVLDNGGLTAPLTAGQVVGVVTATYQGRVVGKAELTVTEDFAASGFLGGLMSFRAYLTSRPFFITAILFITALLVYLRSITGPGGRYGLRSVRRRRTQSLRFRRMIRY